MILLLRFIGVVNAAIWLGGAVFFTFGVAPAFLTGEIRTIELQGGLHHFWPGVMGQLALQRYFYLSFICGSIAVAHQLAEWVYLGRALQRFTLGLLVCLLLVGGAGGLWLQPKLKHLHLVKYGMSAQYKPAPLPNAQRLQAAASFRAWHGFAQVINLIGLVGLVIYFWRVTHPSDQLRVLSTPKFRN